MGRGLGLVRGGGNGREPRGIGRVVREMPVEVGRAVGPPHRAALAQRVGGKETGAPQGGGSKGDTASGKNTKDAVLTNGQTIKVPLFIESGEKVLVDTRTWEFSKRAK